MKLSSWNVNSLKVRLPQVIDWLRLNQPDVLCLQETKLQDEYFPADEIAEAGYHAIFSGQKTYNGVALLSKDNTCTDFCTVLPGLDDPQKRIIAATYNDIRVICVYVPNGERVDSDKYLYKMKWLKALTSFCKRSENITQISSCWEISISHRQTAMFMIHRHGRKKCCAACPNGKPSNNYWQRG